MAVKSTNKSENQIFTILILLLVLCSISLLLVFTEFGIAYFSKKSSREKFYRSMNLDRRPASHSDNFGVLYKGPFVERVIHLKHDHIISDTIVTWDKYFRAVQNMKFKPGAENIVFYGGSFTHGAGLNDNETLPSLYYRLNRHQNVYNISHGGWGPQQLLWLIENNWLEKTVHEKSKGGTLIYGFISDHINRFFHRARTNMAIDFNHKTPVYNEKYGRFKYQGTFENVKSIRHRIQKFLSKTYIGRMLLPKVNFETFSKYEMDKVCGYLKHVNGKLLEKNYRFKIMIFPGNHLPEELLNCLKKQIELIDYRPKRKFLKAKGYLHLHKYDTHPSYQHNWYLAHWLKRDLKRRWSTEIP